MEGMPRPRPPHLHPEIKRGKLTWYYRKGHGRRVRIREKFGTDEFDRAYQTAASGKTAPPAPKNEPAAHSLAWLIARYREPDNPAWMTVLSPATRKQREAIFKQVIAKSGAASFNEVTADTIVGGRDRRAKTPHQSRHFLDAMRGLFAWALVAKHVKTDPTAGVKNLPRKEGAGFIPWTEDHVIAYRARWPLGTRQRVWMEVVLQSGLRRGDAVTFGRQHIRMVRAPDGGKIKIAVLNTEKSRHKVPAIFPVTPALEEAVDAGPCGDLTFIVGANGKPLTKESFGNEFKAACKTAGLPGSAHGLRKLCSIEAAHKGATTAQMRAMFGWTTDAMPELYTKAADRMRLAIEGAMVVANEARSSIPSHGNPVRERGRKDK